MAVYTKINQTLLESLLKNFKLGKLLSFEGIQEGVENSNFKINTSTGSYILTIFEKRVEKKDLPFFIELQIYLSEKKILCPQPISNNKGNYINKIKNKPCVINTFIKGEKTKFITKNHCKQVGNLLSSIHLNTRSFKLFRKNTLGQKYWRNLFENFRHNQKTKYKKLFKEIDIEIDFLNKNWPKNLPSGVIHADAFNDNVFFHKNNLSGIIDFYFSCNDYYAYELAICINAWCFNSPSELDLNKSNALLNSYQNYRKLLKKEKNAFPILLRGAAVRIFLTRLNDQIFQRKEAFVESKDPIEYLQILHFHQNNNFLKIINI